MQLSEKVRMSSLLPVPSPQMAKKFYFLDYFLILLQSCKFYGEKDLIFARFKELKDKMRLGESKYRKLTLENEQLTETQERRYRYTFEQVIEESKSYGLVNEDSRGLRLTTTGLKCLESAETDRENFSQEILVLMESKFSAFYHLVKFCYEQNKVKNGLLIFPIYSPRKLGFEKSEMRLTKDIVAYSNKLKKQLRLDVEKHLGKSPDLKSVDDSLWEKLVKDKLVGLKGGDPFDVKKYNSIISRFRKFWLNYFLKNLYNYPFSYFTFSIWVERGKQLGIVYSTDFYPGFDGKLVYPTSIISKNVGNEDLKNSFTYSTNESLFIHKPEWNNEANQNRFIDVLLSVYVDLKAERRMYFVRLADLRDRVCNILRIPSFVFNEFLQRTYTQNLKGLTRVQISLEADRLPQESNAVYLKREPVLVNGEYKNIIGIDYKK